MLSQDMFPMDMCYTCICKEEVQSEKKNNAFESLKKCLLDHHCLVHKLYCNEL